MAYIRITENTDIFDCHAQLSYRTVAVDFCQGDGPNECIEIILLQLSTDETHRFNCIRQTSY